MGEWDIPTFDVASVRLLRVVDLPEDGLPTRPYDTVSFMLEVLDLNLSTY